MKALCGYRRVWLLLVGLAITPLVQAVEVANLFREEVPVSSQSRGDRQKAAQQAMGVVLVRLSGTDAVLLSDDVNSAITRAENYLARFSYRHNPEDEESAYLLAMEFQPKATIDLLKRAGQPYWPSNRPLILACIALDDGVGVQHLSQAWELPDEEGVEWPRVVAEQAQRRGLPVTLPREDDGLGCETQAAVLNADLALSGNLRMVGESCVAEWSLPFEGQPHQWKFGTESGEECIALGMDAVAELLSASYAFAAVGGSDAPLVMQVSGIEGFGDYADVILMLEGLAMVSAVSVTSVEGDRVDFAIDLQGDVDKLQQAIRMKHILVEEDVQVPEVAPEAPPQAQDPLDPLAQDPLAQPATATVEPAPTVAPPAPRLAYRLATRD